MKEITNNCCGCFACFNICPKECITMEENSDGYKYPVIDEGKCISCGQCKKVCPNNSPITKRKRMPATYAVAAKNDALRLISSSGGVFGILANHILEQNGIVYGVSMSTNCKEAQFVRVDSIDNVEKLYGSKYLQADVGFAYRRIESDLKAGKTVLFSGVPCHVLALKQYLKKDYERLLCAEVICHGVSSPQLWRRYVDYLERKRAESISDVYFRSKKNGWKNFEIEINGSKTSTSVNFRKDPFMKMFLNNSNLRMSCYNCFAKKTESKADVTLGDFWGIDNYLPELDDDKGTSVVMIQSEKGKRLLSAVESECRIQKVDFKYAIQHNPAYFSSERKPMFRKQIWSIIRHMDADYVFEKLVNRKIYNRILIRPFPNIKKYINKGKNSIDAQFFE